MTRYAKPHRVTMSVPVVPRPTAKSTIVEMVKRILADNNPLSQEEWFILAQVRLSCLFRLASTDSRKKKNTRYVIKREDDYLIRNKGKENSLTAQDFLTLNQWIANQDSADKRHASIEALIKRVKQRKRQAKREAKRVEKNKDHHL